MSNTKVFYFTGTGNSLDIARSLAAEFKDAELISIPKALKEIDEVVCDCVGIVFPVYWMGIPLMVRDFMKKIKKADYIFAITNCGQMPGPTLNQLRDELKGRGLKLSLGFNILMPENYIISYKVPELEKQKEMFHKKSEMIREIAEAVKERKVQYVNEGFAIVNWFFSILYNVNSSKFHTRDTRFYIEENCNGCGICSKVCPAGNIDMDGGKPKWKHNCEQCLACIHLCPVNAIQAGKKTKDRVKYKNPSVTIQDLIENNK